MKKQKMLPIVKRDGLSHSHSATIYILSVSHLLSDRNLSDSFYKENRNGIEISRHTRKILL